MKAKRTEPKSGPLRLFLCLVLLAGGVGVWMSVPISAAESDGEIDGTRTALEKWVETRRLISREKRDWEEGRQLVRDRLELVQREIDSLQARTAGAEENLAEADRRRMELFQENAELKEASASYAVTLEDLEQQTLSLLPRLPEPVIERVRNLSQRVPKDPAATKLSLSERYMNIVGILNEVDRFNREISLKSEVHELPDGSTAEVAVFYVGLGQAYYVTNNGEHAGVGSATAEAWVWTPNDDAAANIQKAINILKNEVTAEYVRLPIQLD